MKRNSNHYFNMSNKKRKIIMALNAGVFAFAFTVLPYQSNVVNASGRDILGQVFETVQNVTSKADQARNTVLQIGENVEIQNKTLNDSVNKAGMDTDLEHSKRVTSVMNQLINKGEYALRPNSLPFRWRVIDNDVWNASCYYNDYVEVNSGLVDDLADNNMLAAVLAHEMTHGLHQHVANDSEKQVYYEFGEDVLTYRANDINTKLLTYLSNYVTTKNTSIPSESDADEFGFYLMSSAGFNPGGFPSMILHMANVDHSSSNFFTEFFIHPNNHPATQSRFERAEKRMEEYGYNHVSVKNGNEVYVDNKLLLTAEATDELEDWENAYLIAGGLSKAYHDNKTSVSWDFTNNGDFLNSDISAYNELRQAVKEQNLTSTLQSMVENSYKLDFTTSVKADLLKAEADRNASIEKEKAQYNNKEYSSKYSDHANSYNNLNLSKLALQETKRALASDSNNAQAYGELGIYYAKENQEYMKNNNGEQSTELLTKAKEANLKALSLSSSQQSMDWVHSNLASVADRLGDYSLARQEALAVINKNKNVRGNEYNVLAHSYYMTGDTQNAITYYKACIGDNKNTCRIPEELVSSVRDSVPTQNAPVYDSTARDYYANNVDDN